jgi:hypothetical protein
MSDLNNNMAMEAGYDSYANLMQVIAEEEARGIDRTIQLYVERCIVLGIEDNDANWSLWQAEMFGEAFPVDPDDYEISEERIRELELTLTEEEDELPF